MWVAAFEPRTRELAIFRPGDHRRQLERESQDVRSLRSAIGRPLLDGTGFSDAADHRDQGSAQQVDQLGHDHLDRYLHRVAMRVDVRKNIDSVAFAVRSLCHEPIINIPNHTVNTKAYLPS